MANAAMIFAAATKMALLHGMLATPNLGTVPIQIRVDGGAYRTVANCYVRNPQEVRSCGEEALRMIFSLSHGHDVCMAEAMISYRMPTYEAANAEFYRIDGLAAKFSKARK